MRKKNNFQDLADKAVESAINWARKDSLKERATSRLFDKMEEDFNSFVKEKYGSPHSIVVIKEEALSNRYDEMFYILSEASQHNLLTKQIHELIIALLAIAEEVIRFDDKGTDDEGITFESHFEDETT